MRCWFGITLVLLFWNGEFFCEGNQDKCFTIIPTECSFFETQIISDETCSDADVCQRPLNFTYLQINPFFHFLEYVTDGIFRICCGNCKTLSKGNQNIIDIADLNADSINSSDFLFPVLGFHSTTRLYGYHFIPILDLSTGYYLTKEHTRGEIMERLIRSCVNLWPLLVIVLILSLIAGFIVWVMETWINKGEFRRMFFSGWIDGFWWGFISMTTVGYGDKVPKTVISRLFSVVWILIGITICSMFTASLTNEISSASTQEKNDMHGGNIGSIKNRVFDASLIAKHGGTLKETKGISLTDDIMELTKMLNSGEINGFFLDKYTFMYIMKSNDTIHNNTHLRNAQQFLEEIVKTKKVYVGEAMSFGLLIKDEDVYEYFNEFITNNQALIETCMTLALNVMNTAIKNSGHNLFSPSSGHFYPTLIVVGCTLGVILIFGIVYEIYRKRRVSPS